MSSCSFFRYLFKLIVAIMLVLMSIVAHSIYNYFYSQRTKNYSLKRNVSFHQGKFTTSSPNDSKRVTSRLFTYTPNKDYLLMKNFENFLSSSDSSLVKSNETQIDMDELEEQMLRNLLSRIKKFSRRINKNKSKKSKVLNNKRRTKSRKLKHCQCMNSKVNNQENKIANYKP